MNKLLFTVLMFLAACSSSGGGGANGMNSAPVYATYELEGGCSTGRQVFHASAGEMADKFCTALKDNARNDGCALYSREQLFSQYKCAGTWPYTDTDGINSTATKSYEFQVNDCSTGLHVFAAPTTEGMMRLYCKALLESDFNQNCALDERNQAYADDECAKYL